MSALPRRTGVAVLDRGAKKDSAARRGGREGGTFGRNSVRRPNVSLDAKYRRHGGAIIFGQLLDHGHPQAVFLYIAACALVAIGTVGFGMSGRRTV
jgi:hypothetical protein